jgi:flagellar capping protein FliD
VDSTKLSKALTDNPEAVQAYFIGDGTKTGLATKMNNTLTSMLSTATGKTGVIQNAQDGINKTIKTWISVIPIWKQPLKQPWRATSRSLLRLTQWSVS